MAFEASPSLFLWPEHRVAVERHWWKLAHLFGHVVCADHVNDLHLILLDVRINGLGSHERTWSVASTGGRAPQVGLDSDHDCFRYSQLCKKPTFILEHI